MSIMDVSEFWAQIKKTTLSTQQIKEDLITLSSFCGSSPSEESSFLYAEYHYHSQYDVRVDVDSVKTDGVDDTHVQNERDSDIMHIRMMFSLLWVLTM